MTITEPGAQVLSLPQSEREVLVRVDGVSKKFCRELKKSLWYGVRDVFHEFNPFHGAESKQADSMLREGEFWANKDISFELRRGECIALMGRNGAGKTTLLKMLNGLIKPDSGRIEIRGRIGALIALGAGFNPILTGRENVYVNAAVLGLSRREIEEKLPDIIDFAEIGEFIDAPVQSYSSGMTVRLGFAVATAVTPDVLILDEVLAVGDAMFRAKCFQRIGSILERSAVIFVSHSEAQIQRICNRAVWLEKGRVRLNGTISETMRAYRETQVATGTRLDNWILGFGVNAVKVVQPQLTAEWGHSCSFSVQIECSTQLRVSRLYLQWQHAGASVIESNLPSEEISQLVLNAGLNTLSFETGPLYLAHGKYELSIAAFAADGKVTIAHSLCAIRLSVEGPLGVGPLTQLPATVRLASFLAASGATIGKRPESIDHSTFSG